MSSAFFKGIHLHLSLFIFIHFIHCHAFSPISPNAKKWKEAIAHGDWSVVMFFTLLISYVTCFCFFVYCLHVFLQINIFMRIVTVTTVAEGDDEKTDYEYLHFIKAGTCEPFSKPSVPLSTSWDVLFQLCWEGFFAKETFADQSFFISLFLVLSTLSSHWDWAVVLVMIGWRQRVADPTLKKRLDLHILKTFHQSPGQIIIMHHQKWRSIEWLDAPSICKCKCQCKYRRN